MARACSILLLFAGPLSFGPRLLADRTAGDELHVLAMEEEPEAEQKTEAEDAYSESSMVEEEANTLTRAYSDLSMVEEEEETGIREMPHGDGAGASTAPTEARVVRHIFGSVGNVSNGTMAEVPPAAEASSSSLQVVGSVGNVGNGTMAEARSSTLHVVTGRKFIGVFLTWFSTELAPILSKMLRFTYSNGFASFMLKTFGIAADTASMLGTVGAVGIFVGAIADGFKLVTNLHDQKLSTCVGGASLVSFLLSIALVLNIAFPVFLPAAIGVAIFAPLIKQVAVYFMKNVCDLVSSGRLDFGKMKNHIEEGEFKDALLQVPNVRDALGEAAVKGFVQGVVDPFRQLATDTRDLCQPLWQRLWSWMPFLSAMKTTELVAEERGGHVPRDNIAIKMKDMSCLQVDLTDNKGRRTSSYGWGVQKGAEWWKLGMGSSPWLILLHNGQYLQQIRHNATVTVLKPTYNQVGWNIETEPEYCVLPPGTVVDAGEQGVAHRGIMRSSWKGDYIPDDATEDDGELDGLHAFLKSDSSFKITPASNKDLWLVCNKDSADSRDYCCSSRCGCCFG